MRYVINIHECDKKLVERIKDNRFIPKPTVDAILNAVRSSTPIPKGCGRLVSADVIYGQLSKMIDSTPTIIQTDEAEE